MEKDLPRYAIRLQFSQRIHHRLIWTGEKNGLAGKRSDGHHNFYLLYGLFGLSLFTAERRTKEIGIRKVLGASVSNIVALLSRDFVVLVVIAFVIAAPVAWYFMNQWLNDFAYRTHINGWVFLLAGVSALLIAVLTVSGQAIRAAIANPVNSLRNE